ENDGKKKTANEGRENSDSSPNREAQSKTGNAIVGVTIKTTSDGYGGDVYEPRHPEHNHESFGVHPHRVGPSGRPLRPPSEPCVRVSPHTAQAFQWTSLSRDVPVGQARREKRVVPDSSLCHTNQGRTCSAILMPGLRRTNRQASIVICISQ